MSIKRQFNMVEISLAVAVMALGLTLIVGLFPLAVRSHKDVVANTYIPSVTDKFVSLIRHRLNHNVDSSNEYLFMFNNTNSYNFMTVLPDYSEIESIWFDLNASASANVHKSFIYDSEDGIFLLGDTKFIATHTTNESDVALYVSEDGIDGKDGYIMAFLGRTDDGFGGDSVRNIDFSAHILLFKASSAIYDIADNPFRMGTGSREHFYPSSLETEVGRVAVLVSWPVDVPMASRSKRSFVIDMFRDRIESAEAL